jgi:hypothetical protein
MSIDGFSTPGARSPATTEAISKTTCPLRARMIEDTAVATGYGAGLRVSAVMALECTSSRG